jgi:putative transposase
VSSRLLSGVHEPAMIILMMTSRRSQQRYDHRLRVLVHRTGDVTIATDLGVPRSTARGWLDRSPKVVVSLDATNVKTSELQEEVLELRRRVKKLTALLRLTLALLRSSGFALAHERLPDGRAKIRILRAVDRAREFVPLRALLRFLRLSPSRFHAWRRLQHTCALDDQSSCPHTSPHRLTPPEVRAIKDMVTALEYRHVPTGTLAVLAQRLDKVCASPSTWYRLVRQHGWRRPRIRVHPVKPKVGLRTTRANEMWHIDTTVIRLLDGSRAYLHAVIDNFSRRILAWRVAETFSPANSVAVLVEASRTATPSDSTPVVLADAGVENVNADVDELITAGVLRRVLALTELKFSNSMIEAWWRSLKHQRLFLHSLDSVATVRPLVEFYVQEHNQVLPHSAFRGQTPDEMYFGRGDGVPADLTARAAAARQARVKANRSAACGACPSIDAAA